MRGTIDFQDTFLPGCLPAGLVRVSNGFSTDLSNHLSTMWRDVPLLDNVTQRIPVDHSPKGHFRRECKGLTQVNRPRLCTRSSRLNGLCWERAHTRIGSRRRRAECGRGPLTSGPYERPEVPFDV